MLFQQEIVTNDFSLVNWKTPSLYQDSLCSRSVESARYPLSWAPQAEPFFSILRSETEKLNQLQSEKRMVRRRKFQTDRNVSFKWGRFKLGFWLKIFSLTNIGGNLMSLRSLTFGLRVSFDSLCLFL